MSSFIASKGQEGDSKQRYCEKDTTRHSGEKYSLKLHREVKVTTTAPDNGAEGVISRTIGKHNGGNYLVMLQQRSTSSHYGQLLVSRSLNGEPEVPAYTLYEGCLGMCGLEHSSVISLSTIVLNYSVDTLLRRQRQLCYGSVTCKLSAPISSR